MRSILARLRQGDRSYEPELQTAVTQLLQPGWTCADVGAHRGVFTRLLPGPVGEGRRVVAFEAHPDNVHRSGGPYQPLSPAGSSSRTSR